MRSRNQLLARLILACAVAGLVFCGLAVQAAAEEPEAKKLVPVVLSKSDGIDPINAMANQGDTIAWLNMGPGPITIRFITNIGIACAAPSNFYADLLGNYETSAIEPGGTASICLIVPGEYTYEVRRLTQKDKEKPLEIITTGKITCVKK